MTCMIWNEDNLVEFATDALATAAQKLDFENATRGIDCLGEAELQRHIFDALRSRNVTAVKEARYPAAHAIEHLNYGNRCDLLLFHESESSQPQLDAHKVGYWLEIKRVAQFLESGPNWYYERTLLETLPQDIFKLANDPTIFYAGLLVILFTSNGFSGNRDLQIWKRHAVSHGCPVGVPRICDFSITNRIGNEHVCVALFPLRRL